MSGPWRALANLAQPYRRQFLVIALIAGLGTGATLLEPLIYRAAVNDVAGVFVHNALENAGVAPKTPPGKTAHSRGHVARRTGEQAFVTLLWAAFFLFVISLVARFLSLVADGLSAAVANKIEEDLIHSTFGHVLRLPLGFFGQRPSGALAKQIDQSDQVAPIVVAFAQEIGPEVIRVLGILAIMLTQSPALTLAALVTLPPYLWVARRSAKRLESGLSEYYGLWEEVSARILDALSAIKTVKLSGAESREEGRLQAATRTAYGTYLARNRLENRYIFWQSFLIHLGKALVLALGGWMALQHKLTPGDVVMFVAYLDQLYDPIDSLTSLAQTLQQHAASLERATRLLGTGGGEQGGAALAPGPGRVEFRDARFGYTGDREVLRGLTFTLEPGTVTAVVGPSGAGKTTAADLLLKLFEPSAGTILIDGQPLSGLDPSSVRREVGVVAADGAVFRGTLADNIRYKRPEATDDEVLAAARAAGLSSTLGRLSAGLATEVGERGVGLSVGERQRLQLARVLLSRPRVLVLDEATANLDYATEAEVKEALSEFKAGRTTLVIAHRYSMVADADRVIVLEGGTVAESGTPAELIASGGWFSRLASGDEEEEPAEEGEEEEADDEEEEESEESDDEAEVG